MKWAYELREHDIKPKRKRPDGDRLGFGFGLELAREWGRSLIVGGLSCCTLTALQYVIYMFIMHHAIGRIGSVLNKPSQSSVTAGVPSSARQRRKTR